MNAVVVLTTVANASDASALARALVDERLAACVNILPPMQSVYRWKGAVQADDEHQLVIKTTAARLDALQERVTALHSYDVPELLVMAVAGGSPAYLSWLQSETSPA